MAWFGYPAQNRSLNRKGLLPVLANAELTYSPGERDMETHVYILACEQWVKIGISDVITARFDALQSGCPFKITLHTYRTFPSRRVALDVEGLMHKHFADRRGIGEWFEVDADTAQAALESIPAPTRVRPVKRRGRPPLPQYNPEPPRKPKKDPWAEWDAQPEEVKMARLARAAEALEF